ncbi:efflux RND transporter periplasmic adaptor subunit [Guyparkeria hydrothermalis]|uniref:efflux RND transporter periplasmic adaptor subunit n=1 Tax=Guyparkeria hydrothermalis TaxID=923 RepID=UPI00202172C9|nr:efflux RND transporter periplasmic adaptor subunit [Guyparkeria hydrothermalis]MCL7744471.1 efflux RND transporter periplasmic adaptor subunit [Guyparkeria hydrothermalis]
MTREWLRGNAGWLVVIAVIGLLALWIATGESPVPESSVAERSDSVRVALKTSRAESIERLVTIQGEIEPDQIVTVRAKTGGEVIETPVDEGAVVDAGTLIAQLDLDDREARLREARAELQRAQSDYAAASRLAQGGYQAQQQVERARAELEAARASVAEIELDIRHTRITAPIAGVLNTQIARKGDYLAVGEPVAEIVENDPLRAVVSIPQQRIDAIHEGLPARVIFLDGTQREGRVSYLSVTADPATRTFSARVRVDNPERSLPAGTSVTVEIPVEQVAAHGISPALISQDEDGRLGVKVAIESEGGLRARFVPVEPVRADARRIWVTGLPETVRLIALGQGFVRDGDRIEVGEVGS